MTEAELIKKIKTLKEIKPRKDWVLLTKSQILGDVEVRPQHFLFPFFKPAYAGVFAVLILIGLFEFSQNALPGEPLYALKRVSEKAAAVFVSQEEKPKMNLELANKRLEELNQIVQNNEVKKLAPAMSEFQANVSEAAKNLAKVEKVDKEIVDQIKKFEENKGKVEKVLATKILSEETKESLDKTWAGILIRDSEGRTLTERQKALLAGAKEDFEAGNYDLALEKIWFLSNQYSE